LGYIELGPDGYIYGRSVGGDWSVHRIKYPERGGLACEVQQSYYLLEYPFINLPHFPNYRLGPVDGSPCDTLGLDNHPLAGWRYDKTGGLGVDFTSVSWYEPETWWWDFGDPASGSSNQTSERNPAHTFSAPGAYEVCLTVSNQYGSDTKCRWVWLNTVSTDNPEVEENQIIFYPNPTTGLLQWSGLPEGAVLGLRVHDALGRLCLERENPTDSVDISVLPDGLYHVTLLGANGRILTAKRLVLAKR
ncbi:MAG: PKD domain-containing protein, partial [Saprospiraceae bacterium]|nr:PKD domain-containing protein [Saprospiraceae bacterium]